MFFEVLIIMAFVVAALARRRLAMVEIVLIVVFLHEALHSVRHMNLFALVAAPIIAREATAAMESRSPAFHARWRVIVAEQRTLKAPLLYFPALAVLFAALSISGAFGFPTSFDDIRLSRGAADFIAAHPQALARPFNTDGLGGPLIYRFWPRLHVFIDDRIYVYGDDLVMRYFEVFHTKRNWQKVLDKYRISAAVTAADAPCTTLFRASRDWELAYEDRLNTIFFRRRAPP
jgi:hypothetical protein